MKFPNHIILEHTKFNIADSSQYWVITYINVFNSHPEFYNTAIPFKKFYYSKENWMPTELMKEQKKFTIKYSETNVSSLYSKDLQQFYKDFYKNRSKIKHKPLFPDHFAKKFLNQLTRSKKRKFDLSFLNFIFHHLPRQNQPVLKSSYLWDLFDINFLRKEKIYTKLKYSRVPQYDIVSGGVAALFSGFLGFLICEKFGFELLDSGDFYFAFMYAVFFCFFSRLFLKISSNLQPEWNVFSWKWAFIFVKTLSTLFIKFVKKLITKL